MALNPTYSAGTVSVSAGSAIVNGDGTLFVAGGLRAGDVFERDGLSVTLAETPDSNTQLMLVKPWPGVTGSGAYEVRYTSDASRVIGGAREVISAFDALREIGDGSYSSYAAAQAAASTLPSSVRKISATVGGKLFEWVRDASGPSLGGGWSSASPLTPGPLNIIAHRGGINVNAQNTMPALTGCLSWANTVETDVITSSDGVLRLFHDDSLTPLTDGAGIAIQQTSAQLDALRFPALAGTPMHDIVRIPYFSEFMKWAADNDVEVWPEIKAFRSGADIPLFISAVSAVSHWEKTVLASFSLSVTETVLGSDARIKCGYLRGSGSLSDIQTNIRTLAAYPDRAFLIIEFGAVLSNPSIVEYCAKARVGLGVWTVNSDQSLQQLLRIGVRNIVTDLPLGRGSRYA